MCCNSVARTHSDSLIDDAGTVGHLYRVQCYQASNTESYHVANSIESSTFPTFSIAPGEEKCHSSPYGNRLTHIQSSRAAKLFTVIWGVMYSIHSTIYSLYIQVAGLQRYTEVTVRYKIFIIASFSFSIFIFAPCLR